MRLRPLPWKADARLFSAGVPLRRGSFFPFIVQKLGRERAKLEIEVQVLVKGPFSSRSERYITPRFGRGIAGETPAARSIPSSAWPSSSGLRLLSGPTQVQILPRGLSEAKLAEVTAPV